MGCSTSNPSVRGPPSHLDGQNKDDGPEEYHGGGEGDEEFTEEVKDHMPEPTLPTLLEGQFPRTLDDNFDTLSSASSRPSSRPTNIGSIPTPSIQGSNLDSLALSSIRAEHDKESARKSIGDISGGVPSVCGSTVDGYPQSPSRAPSVCGATSVGAPSICGTLDGPLERRGPPSICATIDLCTTHADPESMSIAGSIAESRLDSRAYLQDLEAARVLARLEGRTSVSMSEVDCHTVSSETFARDGPPLDGSCHQDFMHEVPSMEGRSEMSASPSDIVAQTHKKTVEI